MSVRIFAAIDIGSYDLELKIYQISKQRGIEELDTVRHRLDLGKDTFRIGRISAPLLDELCEVLHGFVQIMEEYQADDYLAIATSAIREADNEVNIIDLIRQKTGLKVRILSNSQQRFLGYKAIASKEPSFTEIIEKPTVIVDLGGGSMQLSLYNRKNLVTTKSLPWGFVRIREALADLSSDMEDMTSFVGNMITKDIASFKRLYLSEEPVDHIIAVGDYILLIVKKAGDFEKNHYITAREFSDFYEKISNFNDDQLVSILGIPYESANFILPTAIVYRKLLELFGVRRIYAPGITIDDGLAYDYADKHKLISMDHDFEEDILAAARNIGRHYMSDTAHTETVEHYAVQMFDRLKKAHHLEKRDKLLLRIAVILHDCGAYVDYRNRVDASFAIIHLTELIGTSRRERDLIARIVSLQKVSTEGIHKLSQNLKGNDYLLVEKLGAIFRLANALDKSHRQVFASSKASLKEDHLVFRVTTDQDCAIEKSEFEAGSQFFREVFGIEPELKVRKSIR